MKSKLLHPAVALVAVDGRARSPSAPRGRAALVVAMITIALTALADDPTISVSARQRYPWNGLVDINFTITGDAGMKYDTSFTAKDMVGNTNIAMQTIRKADGTAAAAKEQLLPGTYNWIWDAAADLPKDFKCDRVTVTGTANEQQPLYMVIDLSGGANASSYPVSYLDDIPSGGWSDTYKTTKLVLRRVPKGSNSAGGSMTKDMWVGIFELTEKQYALIQGQVISTHQPGLITYPHTIGATPKNAMAYMNDYHGVSSLMSKIKSRTGVNFRYASFAEWQYACRAGTKTDYNNGTSATAANMNKVGWYKDNNNYYINGNAFPREVGLKVPNAWGLYDMHGNVEERVGPVTFDIVFAGGSITAKFDSCKSNSSQKNNYSDSVYSYGNQCGLRLFADVQ